MISEFANLTAPEAELLMKAPFLCCILIAGADDRIDQKEMRKAIALVGKKKARKGSSLISYYQHVSEDFEDKLKIIIQDYPVESTQRMPLLVQDLAQLNAIWPKLDQAFARELYHSLREIAHETAESSGGVLGLRKIAPEEAKYVHLPMIHEPV
ncbi:MAG: hypothetical protein MUC38_12180 [Cyclobacteriaceae bacterium]|jgi:hypothetical protein|nr:hypothetical protein [Cyclobacteriaceae bacterium]